MQTHTDLSATVQWIVQILWRRAGYIALTTAIAVGIAAIWVTRQTPVYRASAAIVVEQQQQNVLGRNVDDVIDTSAYAYRETDDYLNTQLSIACSSGVFERVARTLNLHQDPEFFLADAREEVPTQRTVIEAAYTLPAVVGCSSRRKKSSIIDITVNHHSPRLAAQIANAVADAYLYQNVEYKVGASSSAVQWLSQQLDELRKELEGAEFSLYQYRKDHNLVSLSLEERQNLLGQQLNMLNEQWNRARIERLELDAKISELKKITTTDPVEFPILPDFQGTLIQDLKAKVIEERRKHAELVERYLDKHPLVLGQMVNVDRAEKALRQELNSTVAGIQANYQRAARAEQDLARMLQEAKDDAFQLNKQEVDYKRLERNAKNADNMYKMLLTRRGESELSAQLRVNNARILEPAVLPARPISPRVKVMLLLGLVIGLVLSGLLVALLEVFDNTIKGTSDLDHEENLVPLGVLPIIGENEVEHRGETVAAETIRDIFAHYRPLSKPAEFCRAIRTNLLFASPDRPLRKIVVTSPGPEEGKTTIAVNLAVTLAQRDARVLIIDTDLRRPKIHKVFRLANGEGVTTALRDEKPVMSLVRQTEVPNLWVLPSGPLPPNPAELCHSERMARLIDQVASEFDWVILDTPPVTAVTDAVVLSRVCDGTLLLARAGQTNRPALREAYSRLVDVGATVLGCVVNQVDLGKDYRYKYLYKQKAYAAGYGVSEAEADEHNS